jgi:hypothetical protein
MVASSIASAVASSPRESALMKALPITAGSPPDAFEGATAPEGRADRDEVRAGCGVGVALEPQAASRSAVRPMSAR